MESTTNTSQAAAWFPERIGGSELQPNYAAFLFTSGSPLIDKDGDLVGCVDEDEELPEPKYRFCKGCEYSVSCPVRKEP
jgi:hypothetical protein